MAFIGRGGLSPPPGTTFTSNTIARIAQLVEHDLAKVGVAGSSPVSRSSLKVAEKQPFFVRS